MVFNAKSLAHHTLTDMNCLVGIAIQHEQPELEKAKGEMLKKEEDFKVQLAALEKDLLQSLATAEGILNYFLLFIRFCIYSTRSLFYSSLFMQIREFTRKHHINRIVNPYQRKIS